MSEETNNDSGDFYVGYLPSAPPRIRRFVRRTIWGLAMLIVVMATALALLQSSFDPGLFEFGTTRSITGLLREHPYPTLEIPTPGGADGNGPPTRLLLVATGKWGATERVAGLDGHTVTATGTLAVRPDLAVLELSGTPERLTSIATSEPPAGDASQQPATLSGEIVDSKCFAGVMKPGRDKVHRSCAARCISGGVPPLFVVGTDSGVELYLLVDSAGEPLGEQILRWVGEPITISGSVEQRSELPLLFVELDRVERVVPADGEDR